MVKKLLLYRGGYTLVDDEDFEKYNTYRGKIWRRSFKGYAELQFMINGKSTIIALHRLINNTPEGMFTDHINGDRLDNRRCNLRTVDRSENVLNGKKYYNSTSKYRGVYFRKRDNKYNPRVYILGVRFSLGAYNTPEEAYQKRLDFIKEMGVIVRE